MTTLARFLALSCLLLLAGCFSPSPQSQELLDRAQQQALTPEPTPTLGPTPTPTDPASPGPTPTSLAQSLSDNEVEELRLFALQLVNKDRADHGLPPVVLGTNTAAQSHANDMLDHDYIGHWWVDGRKPYMVYTQTGGTTYASENAATSGWTAARWEEKNCDGLFVNCEIREPREQIEDLEWAMMYDDAHANWGHRDNILGETHRAVSIGVASNGRRTTFAQHFEGGRVRGETPSLTHEGTLSFSLTKLETLSIANVVSIYYDPLPTPKTPGQIDDLHSYCVGGGFTTECADPIASVLRPPPDGSTYRDLDPTDFIAADWVETADRFSFRVSHPLFREPGVYTVVVWLDSGGSQLTESLVELSAFQS